MPGIKSKTFDQPDTVGSFEHMESALYEVGAIAFGRAVLQPGWRWATSIGTLSGEALCQVHHINLILSGRICFQMANGETAEYGADTFVDVPPGHDAWVVGVEPVVLLDLFGNAVDVGRPSESRRVVTTVLMTDIVDSTGTASRLGDVRWRQLLGEHDRFVRRCLERFTGHEIKSTGDGFVATFQSSISALRCAVAIRDGVGAMGLAVRIGVHTGEVEVVDDDIHGLNVHAAARIMALAGPSTILVSEITRNLADGSGAQFNERGAQAVKGFERPIAVFELESVP